MENLTIERNLANELNKDLYIDFIGKKIYFKDGFDYHNHYGMVDWLVNGLLYVNKDFEIINKPDCIEVGDTRRALCSDLCDYYLNNFSTGDEIEQYEIEDNADSFTFCFYPDEEE